MKKAASMEDAQDAKKEILVKKKGPQHGSLDI
jgi:hypothetical protein